MSTSNTPKPAAVWSSVVAALLLIMVGLFAIVQGFVAIVNGPSFYVATPKYFLTFDNTSWGWIHIVLGILVGVTGFFILRGNIVARSVGIGLAALQAVVNFVWLPYYPVWGIIVITLDVLIIWALATVRLDQAQK